MILTEEFEQKTKTNTLPVIMIISEALSSSGHFGGVQVEWQKSSNTKG